MCIVGGLGQDHLLPIEKRFLVVYQPVVRGVFVSRNAFTGVEDRIEGLSAVICMTTALTQVFDL